MANNKKHNYKIIPMQPDWASFFQLAKQLTTESVPKNKGRAVILEMLDYGLRLEISNRRKMLPEPKK